MNEQTKKPSNQQQIIAIIKQHPVVIVLIVAVAFLLTALILKTMLPVAFSYNRDDQAINKPFSIKLNQKLRHIALTDIKIQPDVEGTWAFSRGSLLGDDALTFRPKERFRVDTQYTVTLPAPSRVILGDSRAQSLRFTTETAPDLLADGITKLTDGATIAADHEIRAQLSAPGKDLRDLELRSQPAHAFTEEIIDGHQTYEWQPKKLLPQGKTIKLTVYDRQNKEVLAKKTVRIASQPRVKERVKQSYFTPNDTARITFDQPIDPASKKYISFSVAGEGKWQSRTVYAFTPKKGVVKPGKTYSYRIAKGLRSAKGGVLLKDYKANFSTTGAVAVANSSPWGRELSQSRQVISFTFDQPVNKQSAQKRFSVSSGRVQSFSWQGNTMSAVVTKLGFQRTVTATIKPGIANTGFGLPSSQPFSVSFTTEIRQRRLPIPYYGQQHSATCSAATLRMALAYRGVHTGEMDIVHKMGYKPRKMNRSTKPATWDDPAQMFVGSVDGSIRNGTGAGPDAPPIAKAARGFGRGATAVTGATPGWIAQQIHNGHPVIMFGAYSNSAGYVTWKTPSGTLTKMNLTSHVATVTGVVGEPHSPIGFWVNDPLAGGPAYWTAGEVAADLARDVAQQAVVVY